MGATVYLPSANEWYKAAHYDPTVGAGGGDNYWLYATRSDTLPTPASADSFGGITNPGANVANFESAAGWNGEFGNVTTVGSAGAAANSYFGTADQIGNVSEWTDTVVGSLRHSGGGSWGHPGAIMDAPNLYSLLPTYEGDDSGFRVASVASVPVPEPSAFLVSMLLVSAFLTRRRRSNR